MYGNELYHWGIKLQRWGTRRYQNPDGTWTEEGLERRRAQRASLGERAAAKKAETKKALAVEKARKTRAKNLAAKKKTESLRAKYKNDPVGMNQHPELFTVEELKNAHVRAAAERDIYNDASEKRDRARKKIERVTSWINTAVGLYTAAEKVYKLFEPKEEKKANAEVVKAKKYAEDFLKSLGDTPYDQLDAEKVRTEMQALSNLATIERYAKGNFGGANNKKK